MCGIIWAKSDRKSVNNLVWEKYKHQKSRGSDGFGFIAITDSGVKLFRAEDEDEIKDYLFSKDPTNHVKEILFHHRYPTSTPNFREATHPIYVSHKDLKHDYYVVHNGIITNDDDLKEKHNKMGFVYTTEILQKWETRGQTYENLVWNDSEALAIEMALYIEGQQKGIETRGNVAVMVLQVSKKTGLPRRLYYGRNGGNPLKIKRTGKHVTIASENDGVALIENILYCLNYKTGEITSQDVEIGWYYASKHVGFRYSKDDDDDDTNYKGTINTTKTVGEIMKTEKSLTILAEIEEDKEESDYSTESFDEEYLDLCAEENEIRELIKKAHKEDDYDTEMTLKADLEAVVSRMKVYEKAYEDRELAS